MSQRTLTFAAPLAPALFVTIAADENPPSVRKGRDVPIEDLASLFRTDMPAHPLDVVLGRPTNNSITASVLKLSRFGGHPRPCGDDGC